MEKPERIKLLEDWYKVPVDIRRSLLYQYNSSAVSDYIRDEDYYNVDNLKSLLDLFNKTYCNIKICNAHGVLIETVVNKKNTLKKDLPFLNTNNAESRLKRYMISNIIINVF